MDSEGEKLYGAQEAARYLGIHRSTLFLSVQRDLIVPDAVTPGGHYRFRLDTLDMFKAALIHEAATSDARVIAPVQILAQIAHSLAEPGHADSVFEETVELLCGLHSGFDMACIARTTLDPYDRHALKVMAQQGFPDWFFEDYRRLRPGVEFASTRVLRTGEAVICEDIGTTDEITPSTPESTGVRLVRRAGIRAFAVLPVRADGTVVGLVAAASHSPRVFAPPDRMLLSGIADQFAIVLAPSPLGPSLDDSLAPEKALLAVRRLLDYALASVEQQRDCKRTLRRLRDLFQIETKACAAAMRGFDDSDIAAPTTPHLRALMDRTLQVDGLQRDTWQASTGTVTALALRVAGPHSGTAAVGAIWYGDLADTGPERAVLTGLAAACSLATMGMH